MIIGFTGNLGGGKTLGAVQWAMEYSLKAGGAPVATNIRLNPAYWTAHRDANPAFRIVPLRKPDDLCDFVRGGGGILLLDELHRMADARMSMATANVLLSQFVMFLRKAGLTLLFTSQWERQIDSRLRAIMDLVIRCRKWKTPEGPRFEYQIWDWQAGRLLGTRYIEPATAMTLWGAYDSYEFGQVLRLPSSVKAFDNWMAKLEAAALEARGRIRGSRSDSVPPAVGAEEAAGGERPAVGA